MLFSPPGRLVSRGSGQATALIHGALSSPSSWHQPLPRRVLAGRTMAYPLPGHHPWDMSNGQLQRILRIRDLADAYALSLRRDFDHDPVHLVGHSTGAFVALAVASRHPAMVSRLTLVGGFADGTVAGGSPMMKFMLEAGGYTTLALQSLLRLWTASAVTFRAGLASVMANQDALTNAEQCHAHWEQVRLDLVHSDFDQIVEVGRWLGKEKLLGTLTQIRQPALIIAGTEDPVVPFQHQRDIARHMPNGRLASFRETGHLPMLEQPRGFCARVDSSFSR